MRRPTMEAIIVTFPISLLFSGEAEGWGSRPQGISRGDFMLIEHVLAWGAS